MSWNWPQPGSRVAVYLSHPFEIDLDAPAHWLLQRGIQVFAPRAGEAQPFGRLRDFSTLHTGTQGVREAAGAEGCTAAELDVIFVPGLAFDAGGGRLGQGGGWYDRVLDSAEMRAAALTGEAPLTIGVGFDCQIVESVPREPHDRVLDAVLTPSHLFDASGRLRLKLE